MLLSCPPATFLGTWTCANAEPEGVCPVTDHEEGCAASVNSTVLFVTHVFVQKYCYLSEVTAATLKQKTLM